MYMKYTHVYAVSHTKDARFLTPIAARCFSTVEKVTTNHFVLA